MILNAYGATTADFWTVSSFRFNSGEEKKIVICGQAKFVSGNSSKICVRLTEEIVREEIDKNNKFSLISNEYKILHFFPTNKRLDEDGVRFIKESKDLIAFVGVAQFDEFFGKPFAELMEEDDILNVNTNTNDELQRFGFCNDDAIQLINNRTYITVDEIFQKVSFRNVTRVKNIFNEWEVHF